MLILEGLFTPTNPAERECLEPEHAEVKLRNKLLVVSAPVKLQEKLVLMDF